MPSRHVFKEKVESIRTFLMIAEVQSVVILRIAELLQRS